MSIQPTTDTNLTWEDYAGPRFIPRPAAPLPFHVPLLSRPQNLALYLLVGIWLSAIITFWIWWLQPGHRVSWAGLILNSLPLLWMSWFPIGAVLGMLRLHGVNPALPLPDARVAFVVTKAPSEPWQLVQHTLEAMLAQRMPTSARPYDVWLCDEDPAQDTYAWCANHGVRISTRRGVTEYHRPDWPRRTKCKEGNLAYFYDRWGYDNYDVVVQLDADHVPAPTYLAEMVRPFANASVGYVAAPSVCDSNASESWSARGRLYREGAFHGPSQAGHHLGGAPVCIGSHYAVRTAALREAGGIGPELAEDFTTTLLMSSAGWDGAFALDAEAHGEGPPTLSAMLTQEFQWSRSLMTALIDLFPTAWRRLGWRRRLRFSYALVYYPMSVTVLGVGVLLPPIACVFDVTWVNVNYVEFIAHWWAISAPLLALNLLLRKWKLFRPKDSKVLSWEGALYALVRWPFNAWGVAAALRQKFAPRTVVFKVTPKGRSGVEPLRASQLAPFLAIGWIGIAAAGFSLANDNSLGYAVLSMLSATSYITVTAALIGLHVSEASRRHVIPRADLWASVKAHTVGVALLAAVGSVILVQLMLTLS